ncbi:Uncharacterised protein [Clostridium putrefaciens]|uniref:Thioredoxin n=1 Tax=Clostridium putrefaciens TaxID=99675 RepID=A0A381JA17_9CLOT|nr:thioredoxin family protein [Clostridium putrefaciens]SUY47839.1 Uncharacterised protein [Clostridium putrefaciens]
MVDLNEALSYEKYMESATKEHLDIYDKTLISDQNIVKLKELDETINVIAFSEGYCPDCNVSLPMLKRFQEINSNVAIYIFKRVGNEKFLEENLGEARIPTFMFFDKDMKALGVYVEFPEELKAKVISAKIDDKRRFIEDYREGKYNILVEEEFLNIIFSNR